MDKDLKTTAKRSIKLALYHSSKLPLVYQLCKHMVDLHNGEQNADFAVNGEWRFLRDRLKQAQVVFDVGANVGDWTSLVLQVNPFLRVHCFEPSPTTFRILQGRQLDSRAVLNNCGLGDEQSTAVLHITGEGTDSGWNSLYMRSSLTAYHELRTETVRIETFDQYCHEIGLVEVDLVKIDTEGHELNVLKGMRAALQQGHVRAIQFEYGGTYIDARILLRDVWDYIINVNPRYQFFKLRLDGLKHIAHYTPALENFQYANYAVILAD